MYDWGYTSQKSTKDWEREPHFKPCHIVKPLIGFVFLTGVIFFYHLGSGTRNGHHGTRSKQFDGKNEDHREPEGRLVKKRPSSGIGKKRLPKEQQAHGDAKR